MSDTRTMTTSTKIFLLSLLLLLLQPTQALGFNTNPQQLAEVAAVKYWHNVPCKTIPIEVLPVSAAPQLEMPLAAGQTLAMWTTFVSTPATAPSVCTIHINQARFPNTLTDDQHYEEYCKLMVHEFGHFEGYGDTGAVAGTVQYMNPMAAKVPECETFKVTYGHMTYSSIATI